MLKSADDSGNFTQIVAKNCANLGKLYYKVFDDISKAEAYYAESVQKVERLALAGSNYKLQRWHLDTV